MINRAFILFLLIGTLSYTMDKKDNTLDLEEIKQDKQTEVIKESPKEPIPLVNKVNLNEDVPGCTDNYFRCQINCWRVMGGYFDFFAVTSGVIGGVLTAVCTQGNLAPGLVKSIGFAATICTLIPAAMHTLKAFSLKSIQDDRALLEEVIVDAHNNK